MNVVIVYGSQFGTTAQLARTIGAALEPRNRVQIGEAGETRDLSGDGVDLLLVGAPTQIRARRLLVRGFLRGLRKRGFSGVPAAAFDTRMPGPIELTGAASVAIGRLLEAAGCRLIAPSESFLVADFKGPLADGEEERAARWALEMVEQVGMPTA
jgi:flavodoxin